MVIRLARTRIEARTGRLDDLAAHAACHVKAIQSVVDGQLDLDAARNVAVAGGAKAIGKTCTEVLKANLVPHGRT